MTKPHSEDLRIKALGLVESGMKVKEVAQLLTIGIATVYLWLRRKRTTGSIAPKKDWRKGHSHKVTDLDAFRQFVLLHQGKTAIEMAQAWGSISPKTFCRWLKRARFSYKKKCFSM